MKLHSAGPKQESYSGINSEEVEIVDEEPEED